MKQVKGMTLLEVMVALAIFATASISVLRAVSQHVNTMQSLEDKTFAAIVADNQLAKVMLASTSVAAKRGQVKMAGRTWYWKVTLVDTTSPELKAFDVSVGLKDSGSPTVRVRSYVQNKNKK